MSSGVMQNVGKAIFAALGAIAGYLWGSWDIFLELLLVFVALDYVTGFICAMANRRLSSEIGFRGLWKKVLIFVMVAVATLVERLMPGANGAVRAATCCFYISNEGLSILENMAKMGVPFPAGLKKMLVQLKKENNQEEK